MRAVAEIRPLPKSAIESFENALGTVHPKTGRKLTAVAPLVKKKLPLSV
jgi:hypothetical protein